ncbi:TIGR02221 family CRISPR-associated protein [Alkalimonas sp. MEB108]|uniref:TIGR02221 family CRISPR-associated protein n=1 Tax=Alkalimonas cellulosilytica TaxID=3058395 RepID=A0ABU7J8Y7_9GAMM|nr:TIGR02221 family CRISPR-associated protein [Alkalimonas sp. MEB108]MEE2003008.1 TIGR02221 family CRISPR-associated protein [Alkalimonas sp. MEB108]
MEKYLISFLGRTPKNDGSYRTTVYQMPEGPSQPLAYFGYLLQERMQPDSMVILGTCGSMWDGLLDDMAIPDDIKNPLIEGLLEAVDEQRVTQEMLDHVMASIEPHTPCRYQLLLIPFARTETEQLTMLQVIANAIPDQAEVVLDITHSFRHLPMMALAAMQYLQAIKPEVRVTQLCYGEYNDDTKQGHYVDLSGLLHIQQWINAASLAEHTGDLTEVADLLSNSTLGSDLTKASFYMSVHRSDQARNPLKKVRQALETESLNSAAALLKPVLLQKTAWVNESYIFQRQSAQATHAMQRKDYLRATIYAFEAYLTRKVRESGAHPGQESNYQVRKEVQKSLDDDRPFRKTAEGECYLLLRNLRNALAHGDKGTQADVQQLLNDQARLESKLQHILDQLLA